MEKENGEIKEVDNNNQGKKYNKIIIIINAVIVIISILVFIYSRIIINGAVQYPKTINNNFFQRQGMTYCDYIHGKIPNIFFNLPLVIIVIYLVMIIISFIKKYKGKVFLIIGCIISTILMYYASIDAFNCTLNAEWKPILYLYPKQKEKIEVKIEKEELLMTTYPKYQNGWIVTAYPDGSLYDDNNQYYYALYWDEKKTKPCSFDEGFYVEKENAIDFLEEKLKYIGLNEKEKNEFIMFWLPVLEQNKKSIVKFELTNELQDSNKIIINPKPDSLLRVHINIKKVNKEIKIKEQKLEKFERKGFVAVEWGGTTY